MLEQVSPLLKQVADARAVALLSRPYVVFSKDGRVAEITGVDDDLKEAIDKAIEAMKDDDFVPAYVMTPMLTVHDANTYKEVVVSVYDGTYSAGPALYEVMRESTSAALDLTTLLLKTQNLVA